MPHRVMTSRRRRNYTVTAVIEVDKFSGIACSIISCLVVEIFTQKNSIVTKFCHLTLGLPLIMPRRVH